MGYESRLYFVDEYNIEIAKIDLCKMGYEFPHGNFYELFNIDFEKGLYVDFARTLLSDEDQAYYKCETIPDVVIHDDAYGKELKYCYVKDLYKWCKLNKEEMDYRRVDLLYKMVKELSKEEKWGKVKAVFYGY